MILYFILNSPYYYGEGGSFIRRVDQLIAGRVPYKDFVYSYGPGPLYLTAYLYSILKVFGFNLKQAYYVFYSLMQVFGIVSLSYFINSLKCTAKVKNIMFIVFASMSWNISMGINYSLLRFITPFACIAFIHNVVTAERWGKRAMGGIVMALPITATTLYLNFLISPEIGITCSFAIIVYFVLGSIYYDRSRLVYVGVAACSILIILLCLMPSGYWGTMLDVSGGANNFPVLPNATMLVYLLSVGIIVYMSAEITSEVKPDIFNLAIIVLAITLLPGALGRCDPAHVYWYGCGMFIMSIAYLSVKRPSLCRAYLLVFVVIYIISLFANAYVAYGRSVLASLYYNVGNKYFSENQIYAYATRIKLPVSDVEKVLRDAGRDYLGENKRFDKYYNIGSPFRIDDLLYGHLITAKKLAPEYYTSFEDVFTGKQLVRKINDLRSFSYVVVPIKEYELIMSPPQYTLVQNEMRRLFLYPIIYKVKNVPLDLKREYLNYLAIHYRIIDNIGDYYIMKKKVGI